MLVFIDESGDAGLAEGSSRFFSIALVVFEDHDDAQACDQRISLLRKELGWDEDSEFHFRRNSHKVRLAFLQAVAPYNFFYYGIVLNKDPKKLWGEGFRNKFSFYKYTCSLVFENAKGRLNEAIVLIDESGTLEFKSQLASYLKRKMNIEGKRHIKKIKMQRSSSNNLLQLADYVAGVINREVQRKEPYLDYLRVIGHRKIFVQEWPK